MTDILSSINLLGQDLPNRIFMSTLIGNTGFDRESANAGLGKEKADAIAFGVPFLANPDLPERMRRDAPLNKPDKDTFYGRGPKGCTDYPFLETADA